MVEDRPPEPTGQANNQPTAGSTQEGAPGSLPERIGSYRIRRLIGSGGMGSVYEAMQDQPRRIVALKVMRPGIASRSALRRFEYESQLLARLAHPGIAQVFEAGTHQAAGEPVPYFAMEYVVHAASITDYARSRNLSIRDRLALFSRVCEAVGHGHAKGVIHRDLKPSNILVDDEGNPKVIDFGVARGLDSDMATTTLQTSVGQIIGTLQYMSPEQCLGDPNILDTRTDVYALGVILYELLSGSLPYTIGSASVHDAISIVRESAPRRPGTLNRDIRGDLETIILRAIHKNRDRRYQSVADLRDDLERWLRGEPILARRDSLSYLIVSRLRAAAARNRMLAAALAIVAATLLAQSVGAELLFRWPSASRAFETFCTSLLPPAPVKFDNVRLIRLDERTDIAALAADLGLDGVDPANVKSWRRLHGRLLERLAEASPAVVVFDFMFRDLQPSDDAFVAGIRALSAKGVDTVVGHPGWQINAQGEPILSRPIAASARWGSLAAWANERVVWRMHLAHQRPDAQPMASLAIRTLASLAHPGCELSISMDRARGHVRVQCWRPNAAIPGARILLGDPIVIPAAVTPIIRDDPGLAMKAGDLVASYQVDPPPDPQYDAITSPYAEALTAPIADLKDRFGSKVVLLYDGRPGNDRVGHPSGRSLPGAYCHAAGIELLLGAARAQAPTEALRWLLALAGAIAGVAVVARSASSPRAVARLLTLLLCVLAAAGISLLAYLTTRMLISPYIPVIAMLLGAAIAVFIPRPRPFTT